MKIFRVFSAILALCLILLNVVPVFASASESTSEGNSSAAGSILDMLPYSESLGVLINNSEIKDIQTVSVKFSTPYDTTAIWGFPYSDDLFSQPQNYYCHTFARASLGMAVASFRSAYVNHDNADDLSSYFASIGFSDVEAEPYNHEPTTTSVTYAIAHKQIGDSTVIAAVCCGAGYGAEWSGNLTVGDKERHEGFNDAAAIVEEAISEYIEKYNITGNLIFWNSGYSRAAAIANIVAADMTDSGSFKSVYCYTFATPRTTRNKGNYTNIFNIIGKNDPVPTIPFADWGYERYGSDLYTPSVESSSDFNVKVAEANEVMKEIDGHTFIYNQKTSAQLRTFFDYLLELLPTAAKYKESLQPGVLQVMANKSNDNILSLAGKIIATFTPSDSKEKAEVSHLIDYIEELANEYVLKGNKDQIASGMWDPDLNVTQNLTTEHNPDKYISWMFISDNPEYMLSSNTSFTVFTIKGQVQIHVINEDGYLYTIEQNGSISEANPYSETKVENPPELYIEQNNDQTNITIPGDKAYLLTIESTKDQTITYYGTVHSDLTVRSQINNTYTLKLSAGQQYVMFFEEGATTWEDTENADATATNIWGGTLAYSPTVIMKLQKLNVLHLTLKELLIAGGLLIIFTYTELIVCITLGIVRLSQKRPRKSSSTISVHLFNAAVFLSLEISAWYFASAFPWIRLIFKLISFIFIFSLAFVALTEYKCKRNTFLTLGVAAGIIISFVYELIFMSSANRTDIFVKIIFYTLLAVAASLTWLGHDRRRAVLIAEAVKIHNEKLMAKAEAAMNKAYAKQEKETQKYLVRKKKKDAKAAKKAARRT